MTRRDFEFIADTIARMNVGARTRKKIAHDFAEDLRSTNGRFDKERFLTACGL